MIEILEPVKVMYIKAEGGTKGASKAFSKLESKLKSLKGRKFYGIIFGIPPQDEYWAGVAIVDGDNPEVLGLETYIIAGGKYAQTKIKDWNKNLAQIGSAFMALAKENQVDSSRPSIEFYRSLTELLIRLPIK